MQSSDEWTAQNYQLENTSSMPESAFDEPFDATYANIAAGWTNDAATKVPSLSGDGGGLFPKGNIGKQTRRRSRASKKAPTTVLNANANNFRALVQQFTGCHSAPPASGTYKGPINLNFSQYNYHSGISGAGAARQQPEHGGRQHRSLHGESDHQSFFSFGANNAAASSTAITSADNRESFVSTIDSAPTPDPLTFEDFGTENFPLQELSGPGDFSALPGTTNDDFWGY